MVVEGRHHPVNGGSRRPGENAHLPRNQAFIGLERGGVTLLTRACPKTGERS